MKYKRGQLVKINYYCANFKAIGIILEHNNSYGHLNPNCYYTKVIKVIQSNPLDNFGYTSFHIDYLSPL
jgi:hypothetical protein